MKILPLVAGGSVALNLGFLVLFLGSGSDRPPAPAADTNARPVAAAKPPPAADAVNEGTWARLRTEDLPAQVEELRAQGFPPAMVRAIVAARVRESFAARRKELEGLRPQAPYWRATTLDPKLQTELTALSREENRRIKELLGEDPDTGPSARLRAQLPMLSEQQVTHVVAIQERFGQKRSEAGPERYNEIEREMRAELATILTPQQMEEFEFRAGNAASSIRSQIAAFEPTEEEYRTIVRLTASFGDLLGPMYVIPPPDQLQLRTQAQAQLDQQIKDAFGEARYADYMRSRDGNYRQTTQLVARLGLQREVANQLYELQKAYQAQQTVLVRPGGAPPSPEERAQRASTLAAIAAEAQQKALTLLGPQGFEAYKEYGGRWMQSSAVRPVITNPATAVPR